MSTYRVRPNKTNRVWPPVKDSEGSKDAEEPPSSPSPKANEARRDSAKSTTAEETSPFRKNSWRNADRKLSVPEKKVEVPSKSILKPVKPKPKQTETTETKKTTLVPSKDSLRPVKAKEPVEKTEPEMTNSEIPSKSVLRPVKPKEVPPPAQKEKFVRPVLRSVKSKEPEKPPEPESPSKNISDCEWKREAWKRHNRWSQRSTDAPVEEKPPRKLSDAEQMQKNLRPVKNLPKKNMDESSENGPAPPPPPPPPPGVNVPNAPPPPPGSAPKKGVKQRVGSRKLVEDIRKASRTRPDWKTLMKDLEGGIKLKHVKSEDKLDRSSPILPNKRGTEGKFLYDSEAPDAKQSKLLNEIQTGIKLKKVKTNDRSAPNFQKLGIKKLRRQMTKEEKKTIPADAPEALPSSSDDEEDIDHMRDDLKATKLQLAEEIKKTKKMEREAKIQNIDLESLRAEVKKLKRQLKEAGVQDVKPIRNCEAADMAPKLSKSMSKLRMREEEVDFSELDVIDEEIKTLEDQIDAQRKRAEKAEQKTEELQQKLKLVNNTSDEWELRSIYFEKKFKTFQKDQGIELPDIRCFGTQTEPVEFAPEVAEKTAKDYIMSRKTASRKSFGAIKHMESFQEEEEEESSEEESSEEETTESESEEESEEETTSETEKEPVKRGEENETKRKERDVNMWTNKIVQSREKIRIARKERNSLREKIVKHYANMRVERKEYLRVKQELNDLVGPTEDNDSCDDSDDEVKSKAKKLSNRKSGEDGELDSPEEDLEDMSSLQDPTWDETEQEDASSESDDDEGDMNARIRKYQERHQRCENKYAKLKKESHTLKTQATRCDEMFNEEKRRHQRLDNELQMLLTCLE